MRLPTCQRNTHLIHPRAGILIHLARQGHLLTLVSGPFLRAPTPGRPPIVLSREHDLMGIVGEAIERSQQGALAKEFGPLGEARRRSGSVRARIPDGWVGHLGCRDVRPCHRTDDLRRTHVRLSPPSATPSGLHLAHCVTASRHLGVREHRASSLSVPQRCSQKCSRTGARSFLCNRLPRPNRQTRSGRHRSTPQRWSVA